MKNISAICLMITSLLFWSCENKVEKPTALKEIQKSTEIKDHWDFTSKDFTDSNVRLLNKIDVFTFDKNSDSTMIIHGSIFQGWKRKALEIKDTLQLTEKHFVQDSLGQKRQQVLSYSKQNQIVFQLIVTKKELTYDSGNRNTKTDVWFDYTGKLSIAKKNLKYSSEDLYTK